MMSGRWQGLDLSESNRVVETRNSHPTECTMIERLLDAYIAGFEVMGGSFTRTDNDLQFAHFKLATRSFNSLRCAYLLLKPGYYTQALCLLRSVEEDWLLAKDCETHSPTLDALLSESEALWKGDLSFRVMAERQGKKSLWDEDYGHLSSFAHPRPVSLRALTDRQTMTLRLGPIYNKPMFLWCCETLMRSALRMMAILYPLLGAGGRDWDRQHSPVIREVADWLQDLQARYGDKAQGGNSEPSGEL
jgi:hypothetical protein